VLRLRSRIAQRTESSARIWVRRRGGANFSAFTEFSCGCCELEVGSQQQPAERSCAAAKIGASDRRFMLRSSLGEAFVGVSATHSQVRELSHAADSCA